MICGNCGHTEEEHMNDRCEGKVKVGGSWAPCQCPYFDRDTDLNEDAGNS